MFLLFAGDELNFIHFRVVIHSASPFERLLELPYGCDVCDDQLDDSECVATTFGNRQADQLLLRDGWLTEGLLALGRRDEARRCAALALRRARRSDWLGVPMSQRALALDWIARGRRDLAQRCVAAAYAAARRRESAHEHAVTQCVEARLHLAGGRRAQAQRLLDEALAAFVRMDMRWHAAQARALRDGGAAQAAARFNNCGEPVGGSAPASTLQDAPLTSYRPLGK